MSNNYSRQNLKQKYFWFRNRLKYIHLKSLKRKEMGNIYANNSFLNGYKLNADLEHKIKLFWKKFGLNVDTRWQQAYISVNGIEDHRYIPEDIFYVFIEPNLNRKDLYHAYVDKNNYDRLFTGCKIPRTILRNMSGKYYDGNYEHIKYPDINDFLRKYTGDYILKPSIDSSRAKNVTKLQCDSQKICIDGKCVTFENIEKIIPRDFLVQEFLDQHSILKNIYPHSLNTLRVVTLRMDNDIHTLQSIVKFGDNSEYVDYTVDKSGFHCGLNNNGMLNKFAVDKYFKKYYKHPYTGVSFENIQIPQFSSVLDFVKNLHRYLLYFDMVSWDIAIDKNGAPVLIELNLINQGISFLQIHHGPLFGDLTEKLLEENLIAT